MKEFIKAIFNILKESQIFIPLILYMFYWVLRDVRINFGDDDNDKK